jgi:hypothetical protein
MAVTMGFPYALCAATAYFFTRPSHRIMLAPVIRRTLLTGLAVFILCNIFCVPPAEEPGCSSGLARST